jgi:alpha-beta hydrolase superfamily lysophospholipase
MKEKHFDINENGASVRCRLLVEEDSRTHDRVVICTHGYGSSKDVANITRFAEKYLSKHKADAVIAFDWPCHGQDARKKLELKDCMLYLTLVTDYAKNTLQAKTLFNYSVSFGGYLTLKYIAEIGNPFAKIALRAPGIRMHDLMLKNVKDTDLEKLEKGKEVMIGLDRKFKVDKSLFDELAASDVRKYEYFDWADSMIVIHGTADEMVPISDSEKFCEDNVIELVPVEGADHPFRNPKLMDTAIHTIVEFFSE